MKISVYFPEPKRPPYPPFVNDYLRKIEQNIQQALLDAHFEIRSNFVDDIIEFISIKMENGIAEPFERIESYASVRITVTFKKSYLILSVENDISDTLEWLVPIPYNDEESVTNNYKNTIKDFVIKTDKHVRERWALRLREIAEDVLRKAK